MRYTTAFLDEVRDRVALSSIVGKFVIWDKRKTRQAAGDWWACCPFHGEKSPSFHVEDRKGRYHCFGCGVTGDAFRFLMEHGGREFPAAVEEVAELAGVPLPEVTPESRAIAARKMTLIDVNERAAQWFQKQLTGPQRDYALGRMTGEDITRFRIGYSQDGNAMLNADLAGVDEMVEAGLLGRSEDGRLFDRFRGRLMFPILDNKGRAIGFAGRALDPAAQAKYLNTPDTPLFDKGATLYNAAAAKAAAWDGKQLVAVEGQIDVIAATRAGYAAVAPMGTALTDRHVTAMMKMSEAPVLAFDGDAAGRKAQAKAIDLILPFVSPAFTARFAALPDGQDPDSMIKRSPEGFASAIDGAMTLGDALWARETAGVSSQPEDRARLEATLRAALLRIADRDTRRAYGADYRERLASFSERPKLYRSNSYSQHSTSPGATRLMGGFHKAAGLSLKEAILIGSIAAAPMAAIDHIEQLSADARLSPEAVRLIGELTSAISRSPDSTISEVLNAAGLTEVVDEALAKAAGAGIEMQIGSEAPMAQQVLLRRH